MNPVKNIDVETFASDKNSYIVALKEIQPGDMITMTKSQEESSRNHILVIHQVEYQNFVPVKIHYSHSFAYPTDGVYGTGVKQGYIEIVRPDDNVVEQRWLENGKEGEDNRIFQRALKSKTELRRLRWL